MTLISSMHQNDSTAPPPNDKSICDVSVSHHRLLSNFDYSLDHQPIHSFSLSWPNWCAIHSCVTVWQRSLSAMFLSRPLFVRLAVLVVHICEWCRAVKWHGASALSSLLKVFARRYWANRTPTWKCGQRSVQISGFCFQFTNFQLVYLPGTTFSFTVVLTINTAHIVNTNIECVLWPLSAGKYTQVGRRCYRCIGEWFPTAAKQWSIKRSTVFGFRNISCNEIISSIQHFPFQYFVMSRCVTTINSNDGQTHPHSVEYSIQSSSLHLIEIQLSLGPSVHAAL